VIDHVFQVAEQQGESGFAFGNEHGRQPAVQIAVAKHRETLGNSRAISLDPLPRFLHSAGEIYRQRVQFREVRKFSRECRMEHGAYPSQTIQKVPQQLPECPRCMNRRRPPRVRNEPNQVNRTLDLLLDLREDRPRERIH